MTDHSWAGAISKLRGYIRDYRLQASDYPAIFELLGKMERAAPTDPDWGDDLYNRVQAEAQRLGLLDHVL